MSEAAHDDDEIDWSALEGTPVGGPLGKGYCDLCRAVLTAGDDVLVAVSVAADGVPTPTWTTCMNHDLGTTEAEGKQGAATARAVLEASPRGHLQMVAAEAASSTTAEPDE